jgi:hypothetical protein
MNSRRAANRRAAARIAHREPEHMERGFRGGNSSHRSYDSPASIGASTGPGPLPGAGELHSPGSGPGPAARGYAQRAMSETDNRSPAASTTPRGMRTYNQE